MATARLTLADDVALVETLRVAVPLRIAELWVVAVVQWDPEIQRERAPCTRAYLRVNLAHAGAVEMMHAKRSQPPVFTDRDHQVDRRQSATEGSLDDGCIERQASYQFIAFPHARQVSLTRTP